MTRILQHSGQFKKGDLSINRGRKKGSRNKSLEEIERLFANHNFDPATEYILLYRQSTNDNIKQQCLRVLMQYRYTPLKAIEIDVGENLQMTFEDALKLLLPPPEQALGLNEDELKSVATDHLENCS